MFPIRYGPLLLLLVGEDVTNFVRSDLNDGVFTELLDGEGGSVRTETHVVDFFDGFADGENEGSVDEREDDIGVVFVWEKKRKRER